MIKKIRIKFVTIFMGVFTVMLIIILGLVFYFTRLNLETQSVDMMESLIEQPFAPLYPHETGEEVRLPFFILQIGMNEEIIDERGDYYELSDMDFLDSLVEIVYNTEKPYGIIDEYNLRYNKIDEGVNQWIVFADISSELETRNSMIEIGITIGIISFIVFFFMSIQLSKWICIPIELAWAQQKQFISDASHELKTPLTVIMTNAEMLQSKECKEVDKNQLVRNIIGTSHRMKSLVEQMLKLARADAITEEIVMDKVNLSKLINRAILPFEPLFFEKGLFLESNINDNIMVMGQKQKLQELLEVLLDNAYKYSCVGGKTLVTLESRKPGHCIITVKNQGEGLTDTEIEQIFKRFYCVDASRGSSHSFGLGLSIAKVIVEQHKGKIWAESKNENNYFRIELPCE